MANNVILSFSSAEQMLPLLLKDTVCIHHYLCETHAVEASKGSHMAPYAGEHFAAGHGCVSISVGRAPDNCAG
jgi:hypothetical protein